MINKTIVSKAIELHIEPAAVKYTQKGPCYDARLHRPDGEIIACSTEPLFAACRELLKRGITGNVRKYRNGTIAMQGDIEHFAGLTVCETDHRGPEIRKWRRLDTRRLPKPLFPCNGTRASGSFGATGRKMSQTQSAKSDQASTNAENSPLKFAGLFGEMQKEEANDFESGPLQLQCRALPALSQD
jgi:hypothetical protein